METPNEPTRAADLAANLGIGRATRHVFLCADQTKPKCAPREVTTRVWVYRSAASGSWGSRAR
jgi:hypothetical protein